MQDVSCILLSKKIIQDDIGVEQEEIQERLIPIIEVEDVYANEYYKAQQSGFKPSLRIKISSLNYENEEELIYMGITYTIIRASDPYLDEVILICERKVKNV